MLVNELPIEILTRIFEFALPSDSSEKLEHVCKLWLDILMVTPGCWRYLSFDVADDPIPFLDTIGRYGAYGIRINIDNSRPEMPKPCENYRVAKIYARMRAHIELFSAISMTISYQSSLPSCIDIFAHHLPQLRELRMTCLNHDLDDAEGNTIMASSPRCLNEPVFPMLSYLELPGYSFMELFQLGVDWIRNFRCSVSGIKLHISHTRFKYYGHRNRYGPRSLNTFLGTLMLGAGNALKAIAFEDMSMSGDHPITMYNKYYIYVTSLAFEDVSRDFLTTFFSSITFPDGHSLTQITFDGCSIPPIDTAARIAVRTLVVNYIPPIIPLINRTSPIELVDQSLYNAIAAFPPNQLCICNCYDVLTDSFLDWLSGDGNRVEAPGLTCVTLQDCAGKYITSRGVRNFVKERNRRSRAQGGGGVAALLQLSVQSENVHPLALSDAIWFLDTSKNTTNVEWDTGPDVLNDKRPQLAPGFFPSLDSARLAIQLSVIMPGRR